VASGEDITWAIEQIDPDYIVPIHTESRDWFAKSFENWFLVRREDHLSSEMHPSCTASSIKDTKHFSESNQLMIKKSENTKPIIFKHLQYLKCGLDP